MHLLEVVSPEIYERKNNASIGLTGAGGTNRILRGPLLTFALASFGGYRGGSV